MIEEICERLNLNKDTGLRKKLIEAEIREDNKNSEIFYICSKQASRLAQDLSARAEEMLENIRFREARILGNPQIVCCWLNNG